MDKVERESNKKTTQHNKQAGKRATKAYNTQSDVFITDKKCLKSAHFEIPIKKRSNNQ